MAVYSSLSVLHISFTGTAGNMIARGFAYDQCISCICNVHRSYIVAEYMVKHSSVKFSYMKLLSNSFAFNCLWWGFDFFFFPVDYFWAQVMKL